MRDSGPGTRERLDATPEEHEARLQKLSGAVRTILECVGEDPEREGLRETPERYAKAMLYFTKGYEENVRDLVNGAVFHEDHDELVIVKDIDVFSLCEHHMVPFTGKVSGCMQMVTSLTNRTNTSGADAYRLHTGSPSVGLVQIGSSCGNVLPPSPGSGAIDEAGCFGYF